MKKSRMNKEEKMFYSTVLAGIKSGNKPVGAAWLRWIDLQLSKTF
jgi:hypothetical protein